MSNNNQHIDSQLHDKFSEFAPMPDALVWDNIDAQLNQKSQRKIRYVWTTVAATLLIMGSSAVYYFGGLKDSGSNIPVKELTESKSNPQHPVPQKSETNDLNPVSIENKQEFHKKIEKNKTVIVLPEIVNPILKDVQISNNATESEVITQESEKSSLFKYIVVSEAINSKMLEVFPIYFGDFLQSTLITLKPQEPSKRKLSAWAFEVGYDQNQTSMMYRTTPSLEKYVHKNYLERMKQSEFALSAAQMHFAARYQLSSKWSISAGLGWMQNRTQQNFHFRDSIPATLAQGNTADAYGNYPIFGYMGLGPEVNYQGISNITMVSVPVGAIYDYPLSRSWSLSTEALIQANYLTAQKGNTLNYQLLSLQDINSGLYRELLWSAKIGVGVQKEISHRAKIGARINTQGMFTPLYKQNSAIQNRAWSVGLSAYYVWRLF